MRRTILLLAMSMDRMLTTRLSQAWTKDFCKTNSTKITSALERTLPLLQDPTAVPFVCRYRTDVIDPLTTVQIHQLSDYVQKHNSLESLRKKISPHIKSKKDLLFRVETSISKAELEDIYAPFKPPSKGSLEERIQKEHPQLVEAVDAFWSGAGRNKKLVPREAAITLLANRIAAHLPVVDAAMDQIHRYGRIKTTKSSAGDKKKQSGSPTSSETYQTYHDFQASFGYIRDHQVLAIRRGVDQKHLKLSYDVDGDRAESLIRKVLIDTGVTDKKGAYVGLWKDAIHDAWSRLIRKRGTSRLWKSCGTLAQERSIQVFCDNLRKALLEPPILPARPVLALDPGFHAGIKCAILDLNGQLIKDKAALSTVYFTKSPEAGKKSMMDLLKVCNSQASSSSSSITVALGNGHGTQEARKLVTDAATASKVKIEVRLVNEAGASVWSVTEAASREYPFEKPAAVAAISIGRRYQNPLPELVKIPPKSMGLGMYQHDLSEKELEDKLHATSVDAVAEVGVDGNACSLEILEKVPGMTKSLCTKIMKARPLKGRHALLDITGLGPKTFENCAAFIRFETGDELDSTLVHPESYELARWLLKKFGWKLKNPDNYDSLPPPEDRKVKWKDTIHAGAKKFKVSEDRVLNVLGHLVFSITSPDPRLRNKTQAAAASDLACGSKPLASDLTGLDELRKACPQRNIVATVRNIVDFGAFVDFGAENDGLLHRSKLGTVDLSSLLVGQDIGIDILGVSKSKKVSVSLAGLRMPAENRDNLKRPPASSKATKRPPANGKTTNSEARKRRKIHH